MGLLTLPIPIPIFRYEYHTDTDFLKNTDIPIPIPILQLAVPVWHSSLTRKQCLDIERVQRVAFKIILGPLYISYKQACKFLYTQTLEERRTKLCLKFAKKNLKSENCMFTKNTLLVNKEKVETYTGLTSKTFKTRYYGHSRSFREKESEHSTTLSTHIWKLKNKNKNFNVRWEVVARANDFNPISRKCQLCLKEKYYILFHQGGATLNKRSVLFSTCRHRLRRLLSNT